MRQCSFFSVTKHANGQAIAIRRRASSFLFTMARGRGRGSRGRGEGRGDAPREVQISKKLSWLLRHGAESEGLKLGPGGYVNVKDVVSHVTFRQSESFKQVRRLPAPSNVDPNYY
jgi:RNA:NAD 2'-phosphotransferase (TPT1/KptA family)